MVWLLAVNLGLATPAFKSPLIQKVSAYSIQIQVFGSGKPLIFIPGLACGGGVWQPTVDKLKSKYQCFVVTLPGFGKVPPISTRPILADVEAQVERLIRDRKLDKPFIIGHSLGGFMSWWLAEKDSKNIGGIVAVDGVPYLPALQYPTATPKMMAPIVTSIKTQMASQSDEDFNKTEESSLSSMITSQKDIDFVKEVSGPPDKSTVVACLTEMFTIDLRPDVSKITCPAFLMMAGGSYGNNAPAIEQNYLMQVKGIKTFQFKDFTDSKHFIMLDQPQEFQSALSDFLAKYDPN